MKTGREVSSSNRDSVERCPCGLTTLKRATARGRSAKHKRTCLFYLDSSARPKRDAEIRRLKKQGLSSSAIALQVGLSHQHVNVILRRSQKRGAAA